MKKSLSALLCAFALTLALPSAILAQENDPDGKPEYKEGVYVGSTSTEEARAELPGQEGIAQEPSQELAEAEANVAAHPGDLNAKKELQKAKADELAKKDSFGGAITLMSMCIVIVALAILSILFLIFGRISSSLQSKRKKKVAIAKNPTSHVEESMPDSGDAIAAIAAALSEHFSGKHDMEDTILTIRRMKRAYSPWNSKIYNIRVMPEVHRAGRD